MTSQAIGLVLSLLVLGVSGESLPNGDAGVWAVLAGVSGVVGIGFFYVALARGTMGVVAPLSALIGAGLPVLVAVAGGEHVSTVRLGGIALALVAVVLISLPSRGTAEPDGRKARIDIGELPFVILSGLGFAGFFIGIDRASAAGATWWPLVIVRVVGVVVVVAVIAWLVARGDPRASVRSRTESALGIDRLRASGRSLARTLPLFLLTGVGDMGGNAFFVLARGADAFSVAVVLSSLYPVVTTVLAALVVHERLRPAQVAGVVLATLSVPLLR